MTSYSFKNYDKYSMESIHNSLQLSYCHFLKENSFKSQE
uniref:Uncharacterized protein n=1 Tax=Arundo donax TaxID=35708 RepID=A0A0A9AVC9_ARUDO